MFILVAWIYTGIKLYNEYQVTLRSSLSSIKSAGGEIKTTSNKLEIKDFLQTFYRLKIKFPNFSQADKFIEEFVKKHQASLAAQDFKTGKTICTKFKDVGAIFKIAKAFFC